MKLRSYITYERAYDLISPFSHFATLTHNVFFTPLEVGTLRFERLKTLWISAIWVYLCLIGACREFRPHFPNGYPFRLSLDIHHAPGTDYRHPRRDALPPRLAWHADKGMPWIGRLDCSGTRQGATIRPAVSPCSPRGRTDNRLPPLSRNRADEDVPPSNGSLLHHCHGMHGSISSRNRPAARRADFSQGIRKKAPRKRKKATTILTIRGGFLKIQVAKQDILRNRLGQFFLFGSFSLSK